MGDVQFAFPLLVPPVINLPDPSGCFLSTPPLPSALVILPNEHGSCCQKACNSEAGCIYQKMAYCKGTNLVF